MLLNHGAEFPAELGVTVSECCMDLSIHVFASSCSVEPVQGLLQFAVGIGTLTQEMGWIPPFRPRFGEVGADGTGASANLIGQRVSLLNRPTFAYLKHLLLQFESQLVHIQIPITLNSHSPPHLPLSGRLGQLGGWAVRAVGQLDSWAVRAVRAVGAVGQSQRLTA